jgi:hypothetical protein
VNKIYRQQVELLLNIIPTLAEIDCFAIHGGTAINFYVLDLPRYSVDIDVTYTRIKPSEETFIEIAKNLQIIKEKIISIIPNVVVVEKPNKIYCMHHGVIVKIEVSSTNIGIIEPTFIKPLCNYAQNEFETVNYAKIVSISQLYGGLITAALDRQHPRDLFDIKMMFDFVTDFERIKKGFIYYLLGSDRPIHELLSPGRIDHRETLVKQFTGMASVAFSYNDFETTREKLINFINSNLLQQDKAFLVAFEAGNDLSQFVEYQEYLQFPSVQWKLHKINKLRENEPEKHIERVKRLENYLK